MSFSVSLLRELIRADEHLGHVFDTRTSSSSRSNAAFVTSATAAITYAPLTSGSRVTVVGRHRHHPLPSPRLRGVSGPAAEALVGARTASDISMLFMESGPISMVTCS